LEAVTKNSCLCLHLRNSIRSCLSPDYTCPSSGWQSLGRIRLSCRRIAKQMMSICAPSQHWSSGAIFWACPLYKVLPLLSEGQKRTRTLFTAATSTLKAIIMHFAPVTLLFSLLLFPLPQSASPIFAPSWKLYCNTAFSNGQCSLSQSICLSSCTCPKGGQLTCSSYGTCSAGDVAAACQSGAGCFCRLLLPP
jgi:hypothetical protein